MAFLPLGEHFGSRSSKLFWQITTQRAVRDGHLSLASEGYMLTQAGMDVLLENEQGDILPGQGENPRLGGEKFSPLVKESVVVD